jgi:hypothetical protein
MDVGLDVFDMHGGAIVILVSLNSRHILPCNDLYGEPVAGTPGTIGTSGIAHISNTSRRDHKESRIDRWASKAVVNVVCQVAYHEISSINKNMSRLKKLTGRKVKVLKAITRIN